LLLLAVGEGFEPPRSS